MKIIAHRGSSALRPENTIASFDLAIKSEFNLIELDIHLSSDDVPVVIHDETVDRTTNGSGKISSLRLSQIKKLNAGENFNSKIRFNESIPTLEEIIKRYKNSSHIFIEIKSNDKKIISILSEILNKNNLYNRKKNDTLSIRIPGVSIISFDINQLIISKKLLPNINHGYLVKIAQEEHINLCEKYGFLGIFPYIKSINPKFVNLAKSANIFIGAWGLIDDDDIYLAKKLGLSGITVDDPKDAYKKLQRFNK